ncbi:hypothetical protein RRG08_030455 [Elysia crispata]|uniref:Uncharacterized protein n=1 Tax=Elysia crispata TaxID=231223 RepID=A0AAE1AZY1_9GAST|nr:hypothetical protein RRG08_030455 [Elysia crispata]
MAATNIVKAITVLHNFVLVNEPHRLIVPEAPVPNEHLLPRRLTDQNLQKHRQRSTKCGMQVREKLRIPVRRMLVQGVTAAAVTLVVTRNGQLLQPSGWSCTAGVELSNVRSVSQPFPLG